MRQNQTPTAGLCLLLLCSMLPLSRTAAAEGGRAPAGRVYRDKVDPHWFADNNRFWYRVDLAGNRREFILVDAEKGARQLAFDHERLARALASAGVSNAPPERLPLEDLDFDSQCEAVRFRAGGKGWRCDLKTYELAEQPVTNATARTAQPLEGGPRASVRTGEETRLTFINRTSGTVKIFWLDSAGERQSYGELRPGESRDQHTFAGHVWLATDSTGKALARFEAEESAADAEITTNAPTARAESASRPRGRGRGPGNSGSGTSPDGHWRAFIKDNNVWLRNFGKNSETAVSTNGSADDAYSGRLAWSPDSKKLAVLRTLKGDDRKVYLVESSPKDQLQPKLQSYDYLKPGDKIPLSKPHLFVIEEPTGSAGIPAGEREPKQDAGKDAGAPSKPVVAAREIPIDDALFPNPWSVTDLRWDPDSARFTFLYNQRGHQVLRIVAVDAKTGQASAIVDEQSSTFIDYSGKQYSHYLDATGEIIWMSERDGWNHLYLYDAKTGQVKNQITKGQWVVRGVDQVDEQARQIWFRAGGIRPGQDPYYIHYCRVNFDGTGLVVITEGDGTHNVRFSPDHRFFVDSWSRVDQAPMQELRRSGDGHQMCRLEEADASELLTSGWRPPERFVAKGRDGETDIYGIIHWPKSFDPARKYPVIESIYAGPQGSFVPKAFQPSSPQRRLTERGFVVVQIDGMGTDNRSKKFHDVCWKNLGDSGFPDRILWLKAVAAKYPALDLSRVGIYGTSAGGQSALRGLLVHGDFYKAGVADSGCHDNRMDKIWWNEQWMGWPIGPHYEEQSNVTQAGRLQGKLLLMVGELDKNVDPASSMQVVNALIKADKDFELLAMPGAGHGVLGSPYAQRRMVDFFVRSLQP